MENMSAEPSQTSLRFQRLVECIHVALDKSRSRLDVEDAVRQCYGDGDNEVFQTLFEGMLDQLHTDVKTDMTQFLQEQSVEAKLVMLENIIEHLDREAAAKAKAAIQDKESAENALQNVRLPPHYKLEDLIRYQTYQRLSQEKKELQEEIDSLQQEINELDAVKTSNQNSFSDRLSHMDNVKTSLEQTADLCSTLGAF